MKIGLKISLVLAVLLLFLRPAQAQNTTLAPSNQMGIGISTSGAGFIYALNPGLQFGANVGVTLGNGTTGFSFGPYARFLMEGAVNPIIQAGFAYGSSTYSNAIGSTTVKTTITEANLYGSFGLEYFLTRHADIYGIVNIVNIGVQSGDHYSVGLQGGSVGVEWYFSK